MIATKRSIKMYNKRLAKEHSILSRISMLWGKFFPMGNYKRKKVDGVGGRKRKEVRLEKKLKKFGFKK